MQTYVAAMAMVSSILVGRSVTLISKVGYRADGRMSHHTLEGSSMMPAVTSTFT
jgi:hypothetical protein